MSEANSKYLVDVFDYVVQIVREEYDSESRELPYYLYGHPLEILATLSRKDKSGNWKYRKYPLIALFQDFAETKGGLESIEMAVSPRLIIADQTQRKYDSSERYTETFKPILYPLYELLLKSIADCGYFNIADYENIPHTKTDRLFWGKEGIYGSEKNIFSDYLDVIDITFTNLEVLRKRPCDDW